MRCDAHTDPQYWAWNSYFIGKRERCPFIVWVDTDTLEYGQYRVVNGKPFCDPEHPIGVIDTLKATAIDIDKRRMTITITPCD